MKKISFLVVTAMCSVSFIISLHASVAELVKEVGIRPLNSDALNTKDEDLVERLEYWSVFFKQHDWKELIKKGQPIQVGCGTVYPLGSVEGRSNEDYAIADMGTIKFAAPHYHKENIEIYFVLQGTATIVVGGEEYSVSEDDCLIMLPNTSHYTIPHDNFVVGVVNKPPFSVDDEYLLHETDAETKYDHQQLLRLTTN